MKIELSEKSSLLLVSIAILTPISILSQDTLLLTVAATISAVLTLDLLYSLILLFRRRCICADCLRSEKVWLWEKRELELRLVCRNFSKVRRVPSWLKLLSSTVKHDEVELKFATDFKFFGNYKLDSIHIIRLSALGLFNFTEKIRTNIMYSVYPETLYWILRALAILGLYRGVEPSEAPTQYTTTTLQYGDYKGSREYVPGDVMKRIDWRATARFNKLYVKEFSIGENFSEGIVADTRCIGKYTCDKIASALVSIALSRYIENGLKVFCDYQVKKCMEFKNSRDLLFYIINQVFNMNIVSYEQLYEFVQPPTINTLKKLFGNIYRRESDISSLIGAVDKPNSILYFISCLMHEVDVTIHMIERTRYRGFEVVIIAPARPWIDARDVEEAYAIYRSYKNVVKALSSMNVRTLCVGG